MTSEWKIFALKKSQGIKKRKVVSMQMQYEIWLRHIPSVLGDDILLVIMMQQELKISAENDLLWQYLLENDPEGFGCHLKGSCVVSWQISRITVDPR